MKKVRWYFRGLIIAIVFTVLSVYVPDTVSAETVNTGEFVVVLDPGHGGKDSGAVAVHNGTQYKEADMNWKIANYTKQELAKYSNIKVVLTRTKNTNPSLEDRVAAAKKQNADILVSQHINEAGNNVAKGASVLISKGTYRASLAAKEKIFGKYVMEELGKLGISKRNPDTGGIEYRLSENGSKYPNGKARDYYGIVALSIESNLPGVIIEHAFISSYSDVSRFLNTDAKLKKIGQADARAIVSYIKQLPAKEEPTDPSKKNGWIQEDGEYFYYKNDVKTVDTILTIDGEIYYVDEDGKRTYGWQNVDGKTYYFQDDGSAWTGWMRNDGNWYYFNSKAGWLYKNIRLTSGSGNIYLFDEAGKRMEGWCSLDNKQYYVGSNGYALRGFQKIGKYYYCFDSKDAWLIRDAKVRTSDGHLYYIDSNGMRFNRGFKTINNETYYFAANGRARYGWLKYKANYYFFDTKTRIMLKSTTLKYKGKVYKFNASGICTNWKENGLE